MQSWVGAARRRNNGKVGPVRLEDIEYFLRYPRNQILWSRLLSKISLSLSIMTIISQFLRRQVEVSDPVQCSLSAIGCFLRSPLIQPVKILWEIENAWNCDRSKTQTVDAPSIRSIVWGIGWVSRWILDHVPNLGFVSDKYTRILAQIRKVEVA